MVLKNKHVVEKLQPLPNGWITFFLPMMFIKSYVQCVFIVTYLNIWNVSTILIPYVFESTFGQYGPMKGMNERE